MPTNPGEYTSPYTVVADDMNALPAGKVAYASVTADQGSITTEADLTGLSISWTSLAGRYYRISAECFFKSSVANDFANLSITNLTPTAIQQSQVYCPSTTVVVKTACSVVVQPGAVTASYKLRASRASGTGNITMSAGATNPAFILVEDIGNA